MAEPAKVRVRLAPSPTGEVHIGTIWVALFDWLYARQHGGHFILRVEDTDQKRQVAGAIDRLAEALAWYGLVPDEAPGSKTKYGPYVQSDRLSIYREQAERLVRQGSAYYCFCTAERLTELRRQQAAAKLPPRYDKRCTGLSAGEVAKRRAAGESTVIRLNVPSTGTVILPDIIRGQVTFSLDQVDDSILLKSDGFPTYHLAVVVDDHLMEISHVIRAEEWLSSSPKHLLLYSAFGWEPPKFAHLPQILGPNRKKLSKRTGAASALWFRDQGYLPEAMINFLGLMGWHPKGDTEILSRQDLIKQFKLEDVNPSGAVFDQTKLDWLNGYYLRRLTPLQLLDAAKNFWHIPAGEMPDDQWKMKALILVQDRLKKLSEIDGLLNFAFANEWDRALRDQSNLKLNASIRPAVDGAAAWLKDQPEPWQPADLKNLGLAAIKQAGRNNREILSPLREILTWRSASPDVFDILTLLGKAESLRRLEACRARLADSAPATGR